MKQCPKCKAVAELNAPVCVRCGHRFRTKFSPGAPPVVATPLQPVAGQSEVSGSRIVTRVLIGTVVVVSAVIIWLTLGAYHYGESRSADWRGAPFTGESRSHVSVYRLPTS